MTIAAGEEEDRERERERERERQGKGQGNEREKGEEIDMMLYFEARKSRISNKKQVNLFFIF